MALVGAGIPLLCALLLRIVNPRYFEHFFATETRAIGLPLFVVAIVLSLTAFVLLLGSLAVYRSGRAGLGLALFIAVILLFVVPAIAIIVLGPAALIMLVSALGQVVSK